MTDQDQDLDVDRDRDHDEPKREDKAIAPAPKGGALTSLAALTAALNSVDMTSVSGRSGMPMLLFKSRESNGTWMFGQKQTVPEDGSLWATNVRSFRRGYICFNDAGKPVDERLVPITQPMPDPTALPDHGYKWQEEWSVAVKCTNGADAGIEVDLKVTTVGGISAVAGLIGEVRDRLNGGQHDGKVVPIVRLEKDSYQHSQHGRVWTPVLTIVDWMPLSGPAPAPAPASPPPAEQPRRRRLA